MLNVTDQYTLADMRYSITTSLAWYMRHIANKNEIAIFDRSVVHVEGGELHEIAKVPNGYTIPALAALDHAFYLNEGVITLIIYLRTVNEKIVLVEYPLKDGESIIFPYFDCDTTNFDFPNNLQHGKYVSHLNTVALSRFKVNFPMVNVLNGTMEPKELLNDGGLEFVYEYFNGTDYKEYYSYLRVPTRDGVFFLDCQRLYC